MKANIAVTSDIKRSVRVQQIESMFDVPPSQRSQQEWAVDLPVEDRDWQIGLICGPSGCGKSTVAREMFGDHLVSSYDWPADTSILDGFPKGMGIRDITQALSSVGFSSPPAWLRPYHVLSNGEQFRVTMARLLAEKKDISVFDEFTSVVDRTVAQIGSAAIGKAVRRSSGKFVAVTCHGDVEEWLDPDWVYLPATQEFRWRSLRQRPGIELTINRVEKDAWKLFKHHHYLTGSLGPQAQCYVAFFKGQPCAFDSYISHFGAKVNGRRAFRAHRTVVLPDFQGIGIGKALTNYCASLYAGLDLRVFYSSSHPAIIAARSHDPKWRCVNAPKLSANRSERGPRAAAFRRTRSLDRMIASFEYRGPAMEPAQAAMAKESWATARRK